MAGTGLDQCAQGRQARQHGFELLPVGDAGAQFPYQLFEVSLGMRQTRDVFHEGRIGHILMVLAMNDLACLDDHGLKQPRDSVACAVREGLLCFAAFFIIFTLTHSGYDDSEAPYQYMVARQILIAHALGFSEPQPGIFKVAPNGRTYASHEIGNSLFMLPYAWLNVQLERQLTPRIGEPKVRLLTRFLTSSLSSVYAAAGLTFIFVLLRFFFAQTLRAALINVLILGFCSFYWTYSRSLFDGLLCATLLCAATLLLFFYGRRGDGRLLVLAFCFFGLGFISRVTMVIPIAAGFLFLGLILHSNQKRCARAMVIAAFVLLPFFVWQAYYNHLRTGNALVNAVQTYENNSLTGNLRTHVAGLLISPGKGVLVYAPPVLLALFCFPAFFRRYRAEALYISVIGLAWLLVHAKLVGNWHGTFAWGPRHFLTIAPVVAIPFLVSGRKVFRSVARMAFAGSVCASDSSWLWPLSLVTPITGSNFPLTFRV